MNTASASPRTFLRQLSTAAVLALALTSQTQATILPETLLTFDSGTSTYTLTWHGETSHTYFIQHSLNLQTWNTVPVIETGADAALAWSLQLTVERTFFRVLATDQATGGDPDTADFDGDGLNNLAEVNLGSNPLSLDSDRDGMPDAWEHLHGFELTLPDGTENPDGDTLTNLAEYSAGTDPHSAATSASPATFDLVLLAP